MRNRQIFETRNGGEVMKETEIETGNRQKWETI